MAGLIDVYLYAFQEGQLKFLLFRRAHGKIYQGQWRMVGGKKNEQETHWQAALREMNEETGLVPEDFWVIPSLNHFYEHKTDQIRLIPAFAAEVPREAEIRLDDEHTEARWITSSEVPEFVIWPEQRKMFKLLEELVLNEAILPEWRIFI